MRDHLAHALLGAAICGCLGCGASDSAIGPPGPPEHVTIDVRYATSVTPAERDVVVAAADKWSRALIKNRGDFKLQTPAGSCFVGEPKLDETHHGFLLFVSFTPIDGPGKNLAYTQVCSTSGRDTLPVIAHIRVDAEDVASMQSEGTFPGVILHELGHALGFNPDSYMPKQLAAGGTADPYFTGPTARAQFSNHGAWYQGVLVPLENSSSLGPRDPHWRFNVFGDELMIPVAYPGSRSPLSVVTLGAFKDLGYDVDFSVADSYEVVPLFGNDKVLPVAPLWNDMRPPATALQVVPALTR